MACAADLGFNRFRIPGMQTLCHLLNGAGSRNIIAHYLREQVPSPEIVIPKFAASLQRRYSATGIDQVKIDRLVSAATALLRRLIENGKFGTEGEGRLSGQRSGPIHSVTLKQRLNTA